ncbi:MAG: phage integrase N-terminal SAM-like domain-containing protein [Nanoarchaeota archaeon]
MPFPCKINSGLPSTHDRDFLNFTGKEPSHISKNDVKNYLLYLVYLAEEKQAATSTLNQAINDLKFYFL